jgi:hypothetical protein
VHAESRRGIHLADGAADFLVRLGDIGAEEVDSAHIETDGLNRAHRHLDVVGVDLIGHIGGGAPSGEIAGGAEKHSLTVGRNRLPGIALVGQQSLGLMIEGQTGQHLLMPDASAGVPVDLVHQLFDGVYPVAHDVSGHPECHGHQLAIDHQHPVVIAGDEALDDDASAVLAGDIEGVSYLFGCREMNRDAAAVIGIERLHHDRVADPFGGGHGVVRGLNQALLRHR